MAPRAGRKLNESDFNTVFAAQVTLSKFLNNPQMEADAVQLMQDMPSMSRDGTIDQNLRSSADKALASVDEWFQNQPKDLDGFPRAKEYRNQVMQGFRADLDYFSKGHSVTQDKELEGPGSIGLHNLVPNMNTDCFSPEKVQETEKTLQEYPLDQFVQLCNQVQSDHMEYEIGKEERSKSQNEALRNQMRERKQQLLSLSKDLQTKTANPTPEVVALFGNKDYLTSKTGFIGHRGLGSVISGLEKDLGMVPEKEVKSLDDSLKRFNTSRSFIFKKESDAHREMREAAEKVQENMKLLNSGTIKDEKTGKERAMTEKEHSELMAKTHESMKLLEEKTDAYIASATKDGKTPNTPAGKERLAGARDMKQACADIRKSLGENPKMKEILAREEDLAFKQSLPEKSRKFIEKKEKDFKQMEGMSRVDSWGPSKNMQIYNSGLNEFQYMAGEMITLASLKEGVKNGQIEPDRISTEFERSMRKLPNDPEFKKWAENLAEDYGQKRRVGEMNMDEIRKDYVTSMSKNMERTVQQKQVETAQKSKSAEKSKAPEKTSEKSKTKKAPEKKEPQKQPVKTGGPTV